MAKKANIKNQVLPFSWSLRRLCSSDALGILTNRHGNTVKPGRNQDQVQASSPHHYEYYCDIVKWLYKIPLVIPPHQLHIYFNDMGIACKSQWGRKQFSKLKNQECSSFLQHLYTDSKQHRWWFYIKKSCGHILTTSLSEHASCWWETFYSFLLPYILLEFL